MIDATLESAAGDLSEVRDRLDATREALQRALEAGGGEEVRAAIARLERIEAEVARVERVVAVKVRVEA